MKLYLLFLNLSISLLLVFPSYAMQPEKIQPGHYQNYKGTKYEVIGVARFSEDPHKKFVIYKQEYESKLQPEGTVLPIGTLWVRPEEMFLQLVDYMGKKVHRFSRID